MLHVLGRHQREEEIYVVDLLRNLLLNAKVQKPDTSTWGDLMPNTHVAVEQRSTIPAMVVGKMYQIRENKGQGSVKRFKIC